MNAVRPRFMKSRHVVSILPRNAGDARFKTCTLADDFEVMKGCVDVIGCANRSGDVLAFLAQLFQNLPKQLPSQVISQSSGE